MEGRWPGHWCDKTSLLDVAVEQKIACQTGLLWVPGWPAWEIGSSWSTSCWVHYSEYPPLSSEIICKDYKRWLYFDDPLIAKILARSKFCLTSGPRTDWKHENLAFTPIFDGGCKDLLGRIKQISMCGFPLRGWTHYFSTRKLSFVKPFTNP